MRRSARRRLTVVVPAAAAILGVTAVQSGAAEACSRWFFGDDGPRKVDVTRGSTARGTEARGTEARGTEARGTERSSTRNPALVVEDGADLGMATGRFTLAGTADLPQGAKVVFTLSGPSKLSLVDGRSPFRIAVNPRTMRLKDGQYSVATRVVGQDTSSAVADLVISTKRFDRGSRSRTTTEPEPTTTPPTGPAAQSAEPASSSSTTTPSTARESERTVSQPDAPSEPATKPEPVNDPEPVQEPVPVQEPEPVQPAATASTTTSPPAPAPAPARAPASSKAAEVVRLTNERRAANNCPALTVNAALTASAQAHSEDMAARDYFSHTGLDNRSLFDRMKDAGYRYRMAAENIAVGQPTPQAVVTGWMNSPGHRANILNCGLTEIGVGVAEAGSFRIYWTQNFGTPR